MQRRGGGGRGLGGRRPPHFGRGGGDYHRRDGDYGYVRAHGGRRGALESYEDEPFDHQADRKARRKAERLTKKRQRVEAHEQWVARRRQKRNESQAARSSRAERQEATRNQRRTRAERTAIPCESGQQQPRRPRVSSDDCRGKRLRSEPGPPPTEPFADEMSEGSGGEGGDAEERPLEDVEETEETWHLTGEGDDERGEVDGTSDHTRHPHPSSSCSRLRACTVEVPQTIRTSVARCVNKLTIMNVLPLTTEVSALFGGSGPVKGSPATAGGPASRAAVLAALVDQVDRLCRADTGPLTLTNTLPFAGLLRGLQLLHGQQVGAELVERLCCHLHDHLLVDKDENAAGNLAMVVSQLHLLHGVDAVLLISLLRFLLTLSQSTTVSLVRPAQQRAAGGTGGDGRVAMREESLCAASCALTVLRSCGEKLIKEVPREMSELLGEAEKTARRLRTAGVVGGARFEAFVELMKEIAAGHTRKGRRTTTESEAPVERMLEDLCAILLPSSGGAGEVHRRTQRRVVQTANVLTGVTWEQVTMAEKPPRWFVPGVMAEADAGGEALDNGGEESAEGTSGSSEESDLDEEAPEANEYQQKQEHIRRLREEERAIAGQRLNTEHKREIFKSVAAATDDLECFSMLMQRDPAFTRFPDVCAVILQCCCQERRYNPYYTRILERFCLAKSACRKTLQFAIWDRLKSVRIDGSAGSPDVASYLNFACMITSLLESGTFRLSLLRGLDLENTNKTISLFTRMLLLRILTQLPAGRLANLFFGGDGFVVHDLHTDTKALRTCLQKFMAHYFIDEAVATRWLPLFFDVVAAGTEFDVHRPHPDPPSHVGHGAHGSSPPIMEKAEAERTPPPREKLRTTSAPTASQTDTCNHRTGKQRNATQGGADSSDRGADVGMGDDKLQHFFTRVRVAYKALKQGIS